MSTFSNVFYSFPVQLLVRHIKKNLFVLGIWTLFALIILGKYGKVLGIPFLFLDPEYLGSVGFWSFYIVGISFGIFATAFNIICYILYSTRFRFVGLLKRPFSKFSLNNAIVPVLFIVIYITQIIRFQIDNSYVTANEMSLMLLGLILGMATTILLLHSYFLLTNKNRMAYLTRQVDIGLKKINLSRSKALEKLKESKTEIIKVDNYFDLRLRNRKTEELKPIYDKDTILKVFDQNHFNSVILQFLIIGLILILRYFMDYPVFQIPAAASTFLMATIVIMILGASTYWFRDWSIAFIAGMFLLINGLMKNGVIEDAYLTPGMIYENHAAYNTETIRNANAPNIVQEDRNRTLDILNNWRQKFDSLAKPKMILLCVSGGGQRSALWTFNSMVKLDSALQGRLMKHTMLLTGASGGIIGASYFRELSLRKTSDPTISLSNQIFTDNIAKDNLNPVIFSLVVNDVIIKNQKYKYAGQEYLKDRGLAFENQLNRNTAGIMDKPILAYRNAEFDAQIPMLIMAPSVSLDGRKLYISPQSVSYMNVNAGTGNEQLKLSGVDFFRFFENNGAENLRFLTALRMNASFPYVTPNVTLPSVPAIEIMDAGVVDNYGISDALRFLHVFKDWIEQNTSGVILLSIRDSIKEEKLEGDRDLSIIERFSVPISSVYNNLGNQQEINNDYKFISAKEWFDGPIDMITIEYNTNSIFDHTIFKSPNQEIKQKQIERASLSWHLTKKEKQNLLNHINDPSNKIAMNNLRILIFGDEMIE